MRRIACILFLMIVACACGGCSQSTKSTKWEYKTIGKEVVLGFPSLEEELKKAGDDGWELVSVLTSQDAQKPPVIHVVAVLKKPKP
jgi:hypothetical protein